MQNILQLVGFWFNQGEKTMLWTIFIILLILWLLGLVSGAALGNYVHILLIIAVVVLIIQLITGRRPSA